MIKELNYQELNGDFLFYQNYYENLRQKGVTGKWFEQFDPGSTIVHPRSFKVTSLRNILICAATLNPQPIHTDEEFAKSSYYGRIVPNGLATAGGVMGYLTVEELTNGTLVGAKEFTVKHILPVFENDEVSATTRIGNKSSWDKGNFAGIVEIEHSVVNQKKELVMKIHRKILVFKKPNI